MSINDIMNYVSKTPGNTNPAVIKTMVESENYTVLEKAKQMDEETLVMAKSYTDRFFKTTQEVLVSEAVSTSSYEIDPALNIAVGDSLTVIFNGVEYNCTVMGDDGFLAFGDLNHDTYPFAYIGSVPSPDGKGIFFTQGYESKTFSIIKNIFSIEQKYITPKIVDFDELGLTAPVLELVNAGGGDVPLENIANGPILDAFPSSGDYIAKLTVPGMGVMYVKPVYTLFDEYGFELAHFDSYLEQNGQLIKFYVRVLRPGYYHRNFVTVEVGFFT